MASADQPAHEFEGNLSEVALSSLRLAAGGLDVEVLDLNLTDYEHLRHVDAELLDGEAIVRAFGSWEVAKHAATVMGPARAVGSHDPLTRLPPIQP